jgi:hypothetical protein
MIKIKVKTTWQGKVGIREKYVSEALEKSEPIIISYNNETMTIPFPSVKSRVRGISARLFKDRFSKGGHHLVYYDWQPDIKQPILL